METNPKTANEVIGDESLKNFSPTKVILPIILGLGVIGFLMYREFDVESFQQIDWRLTTATGLLAGMLLTCTRFAAHVWRIRILTEKQLSWKQCFQVMALWEFTSAVTPSMVGGTAAGLYLLTKEKIKFANSTSIIFSTIFLDSFYFLATIVLLWIYFGNYLISPHLVAGTYDSIFDAGKWVYAFFGAFTMMCTYTSFIAYGLFINPKPVKWILNFVGKLPLLNRWESGITGFADELASASIQLRSKGLIFWAKGFLSTAIGWSSRFLVVVFIVTAFVEVGQYLLLYGRQLSLYLILFLTPTPGGSGMAEFAFKDFYIDFIGNVGLGTLIGAIWRLLTYFPFLVLGVIVLPNWISRVFGKKDIAKNT